MAIQLDMSHGETLQHVLNFLEHHLPHSIHLWQLLTFFQQNVVTHKDIYPELFVDDPKEIKCSILLYSTPGLPDEAAVHNHTRNVAIACERDHTEDVLSYMLETCIPWNQMVIFCCIDSRYMTSSIQRFVQTKQLGKCYVFTCYQLEMDRKTFENGQTNLPSIPEGYEIRPLSIEDAPLIYDTWIEKESDLYSLAQVRFSIECMPTFGAYRDGKLVAWQLIRYDGSNDMAFTLPEGRNLGLSYLLGIKLTTEAFKSQRQMFAYVDPSNKTSLRLAIKIGHRITGMSDWNYFVPNGVQIEKSLEDMYTQMHNETMSALKSSL